MARRKPLQAWAYELEGERQPPLPEDDLVKLIAAGTLSQTTLVWRQGMETWQPASQTDLAKYFDTTGAPKPEAIAESVSSQAARSASKPRPKPPGETRSVKGFQAWLQISLVLFVIASGMTIAAEINTLKFFDDVNKNVYETDALLQARAALVDLITAGAYVLYLILFISSVSAYSRFFHRIQTNLQALHAPDATSRPVETWIWYFVPIANLFKPLGPFNEAQQASHEMAGESPISGSLVLLWWLTWIFGNIVANISQRLPQDDIPQISVALYFSMASAILLMIAGFTLYRMVKRIGAVHELARRTGHVSVFD